MPILGTRGTVAAGAYEPKSIGAPYWASSYVLPVTKKLGTPRVTNNGGVYFVNNNFGIGYINPNGGVVWQKDYSLSGLSSSRGFAVDAGNNSYSFLVNSNSSVMVIYKTDQSGNVIWQKQYTPSGGTGQLFEGFTVSQLENVIYVAGMYFPTGGGTVLQVIKISTVDGSILSQAALQNVSSSTGVAGVGVATSKLTAGVCYVGGYYYVDANNRYPFLAKYNGTTLQWQTSLFYQRNPGGTFWYNQDYFYTVNVDNNDNVYVTGNIDKLTVVSGTTYAINCGLIAKYDSSGNLLWQKNVINNTNLPSGPANTAATNAVVNTAGNLFVACDNYSGGTNNGVFNYNPDGTIKYQKLFTPPTVLGSVDFSNNLYLSNSTQQSVSPYNVYANIYKFQNDNSTKSPITLPNGSFTFVSDTTSFVSSAGVSTPATTSFTSGTTIPLTVSNATGTFTNTTYTSTVTLI